MIPTIDQYLFAWAGFHDLSRVANRAETPGAHSPTHAVSIDSLRQQADALRQLSAILTENDRSIREDIVSFKSMLESLGTGESANPLATAAMFVFIARRHHIASFLVVSMESYSVESRHDLFFSLLKGGARSVIPSEALRPPKPLPQHLKTMPPVEKIKALLDSFGWSIGQFIGWAKTQGHLAPSESGRTLRRVLAEGGARRSLPEEKLNAMATALYNELCGTV